MNYQKHINMKQKKGYEMYQWKQIKDKVTVRLIFLKNITSCVKDWNFGETPFYAQIDRRFFVISSQQTVKYKQLLHNKNIKKLV